MMYKLAVLPQWTTSAISRWRETRFVYLAKMEASHGQKGRQIVAKRLPLLCIGKMEIEAEHGERERIAAWLYHKEMRFVHLLRISEKWRLERCMDRKENLVIRKIFKIKLILRKKSNLGNMQQMAWNHEKGFNLKKPDNLRQ